MKRRYMAAVIAASALVLAACGSGGGSSGGGGGSLSIGYVSPVASQPGQAALNSGLTQASHSLGWNVQFLDANLSSSAMVSDVQTLIQEQKGAIGVWPLDPGALQGTFAQAAAAKIPIIAVNTTGTGIDKTVYWQTQVCTGDSAPYKVSAARIAKLYPGGSVIVMGGPAVPSIQANVTCFKNAAAAAGLHVLTEADNTDDTSAGAATLAAPLLTKYPDVNAFWAYNDSSALGISSSVIAAGKKVQSGSTQGVYIEGTNGDADAISAVQQGRLTGTWDTDPVATGVAVAKAIQQYTKNGDKAPLVVKAVFYDSGNIGGYVPPDGRHYTVDNVPLVSAS